MMDTSSSSEKDFEGFEVYDGYQRFEYFDESSPDAKESSKCRKVWTSTYISQARIKKMMMHMLGLPGRKERTRGNLEFWSRKNGDTKL